MMMPDEMWREWLAWTSRRADEMAAEIEVTEGKGWWSAVRDDVEPFELAQ